MPMQDSLNFIREMRTNRDFRRSIYRLKNAEAVQSFLVSNGYHFTHDEFEDSYRKLLLKCQEAEQAEELMQILTWYQMLLNVSPI